jgi:hypothetical protein
MAVTEGGVTGFLVGVAASNFKSIEGIDLVLCGQQGFPQC